MLKLQNSVLLFVDIQNKYYIWYVIQKQITMTTTIQTTERTFNKNVKREVLNLMPSAKTFKKSHVAGVGYVYFIKDQNKNTLGKVFKEVRNGMKIYVD